MSSEIVQCTMYKTREEILATKIMQKYSRDELKKMDIIDIEDIFY